MSLSYFFHVLFNIVIVCEMAKARRRLLEVSRKLPETATINLDPITDQNEHEGIVTQHLYCKKALRFLQEDLREKCDSIMKNSILVNSKNELLKLEEEELIHSKVRYYFRDWFCKEQTCPSNLADSLDNEEGLNKENRCLSPIAESISFDPYRIPSFIYQKKCGCKGCFVPIMDSDDMISKTITVPVKVFYETSQDAFNPTWEIITQDIAVGCKCDFPKYIQSD